MTILAVLAAVVLQTGADGCGSNVQLDAEPARPRQGTLFRVRVSGITPDMRLSGAAAGEALHFSIDGRHARSMAAAPIDSASVDVVVECSRGSSTDTIRMTVPLAPGAYRMERLKVAPRFSAKPDSALEARQRREADRAAEVSRQAHETPKLWYPQTYIRTPARTLIHQAAGVLLRGTWR